MVVQIEVVNGKIELVDRRRKITGGWMTNDSTFKDVKKKKREKKEGTKTSYAFRRGGTVVNVRISAKESTRGRSTLEEVF